MGERVINTSDPRASYLALRGELDAAIQTVLNGPGYILGDAVQQFEQEFARYIGVDHGIGVNNGTDAIHLSLRALGIGPGDEVITVSHTAVATVAAIEMAGATPVLVDVVPEIYTMDPKAVEPLITTRTRAIIAVHLYGHAVDIGAIRALCREHGLAFIEDCAQAHGARWYGSRVGSFGDLATFSFYPTKNLGAIGDAGMIITRDHVLAAKLRLLRQYGWEKAQYSMIPGWNSRLDPLQAAILSVKLKHLDRNTTRRRELAANYSQHLKELPFRLPTELDACEHVYHLYVVELQDHSTREELRGHLAQHGIHAGIHYPFGVHQQPAYHQRIRTGPMTVTEGLARTVLSLPLYPELTDTDQQWIISTIRSFFLRRK